MTNEEMKKEVLLRAKRWKEQRKKRQKRLLVGGAGLLFAALLTVSVPRLLQQPSPTVTPPSDRRDQTTTVSATTAISSSTTATTTQTQTKTTAATTATQTTVTTQTRTTTRTRYPHSEKGTAPTTSMAVGPFPGCGLWVNGNAVYQMPTDEERTRYGIPATIRDEDLGEFLGVVSSSQADGSVFATEPSLIGGKAYVYQPFADRRVLVVLCGTERYVFLLIQRNE